MRVSIRFPGRWARPKDAAPLRALFEDYARRLPWPLEVVAVEPLPKRRPDAPRQRKGIERALVVALDAGGKALDSREFARKLQTWLASGANELVFLVGGRDGLDAGLARDADMVLSLGPMTWPHRLVPVMLAEQLYRAHCILTGHPYQGDQSTI